MLNELFYWKVFYMSKTAQTKHFGSSMRTHLSFQKVGSPNNFSLLKHRQMVERNEQLPLCKAWIRRRLIIRFLQVRIKRCVGREFDFIKRAYLPDDKTYHEN